MQKVTLRNELSDPQPSLSSPPPEALAAWRVFFECALALPDILDAELEDAVGLPFRWYDVLVQLEEAGHGAPMNEVASRILASKSGLTRVIDRMEEAGLVRRERRVRPPRRAGLHHRRGARHPPCRPPRPPGRHPRHFTEHLTEAELRTLARTLEKVRGHVRPLRPGRVTG